uniref:uncharacterized protein C2orf42 homolog n=1 Tax=Doryrhamphus excisus TaxID=161450 RepID=UPI0025AE1ABB|nr:uncharacterized protein C2orf42 homolog [Doryrhamphus excisus]XP_057920463.1 uncharacterized protein C2orf42 homolog [Doryrhamphus excisus]
MESASSSYSHVLSPFTQQTSTPNLAAKQRDSRKGAPSVTPAFLSNLGRATLRGIRKCPQCGVYNGTRGLSCKNAVCGVSLRNASLEVRRGRKDTMEVVKVITDGEEKANQGGGVQVFSVCQKGRANTQFGFVELVATDATIATGNRASQLSHINLGRCFMAACKQGQKSSHSKVSYDSLCAHIKHAIECANRATPLSVKSSVLEALQASVQAKEELWRLATESLGPLVQRVSRDTLVVKCHPDSKHPHGLLHLTVGAGGRTEAPKNDAALQQQQAMFHCGCQGDSRRGRAEGAEPGGGLSVPCLHFYACVCAFASDEKLTAEFAAFINSSSNGVLPNSTCRVIVPCERPPLHTETVKSPHKAKKLRQEEALLGGGQAADEHSVTLGFHQWLAGVTERIHQAMHYQLDGNPEPLVYHIPQPFFNALQHRLSLGSKRRLPNFTTVVVRRDAPPLGSFSKYTWHITNLAQVKRIFDTPELELELTQSFVKNVDGSYSRFRCPQLPPPQPELPEGAGTDRPQAIRPMELQTFLRVGPGLDDLSDARPLEIEWTPDVLPLCHMGELRIRFEFGHRHSGQQPDSSDCVKSNVMQGAS